VLHCAQMEEKPKLAKSMEVCFWCFLIYYRLQWVLNNPL
jgi:hypothetical protein